MGGTSNNKGIKMKELCVICDQETGRAGIHDDSMFPVLKLNYGYIECGDTVGPLCEDCYFAMEQLKMIDYEG